MEKKLKFQAASKLTVIIDSDKKYDRRRLYKAVQNVLLNHDVAGFTMVRGAESFGSSRVIHSLRNEMTMSSLPLVFEAIDDEEKIRAIAEVIAGILGTEGLVQIQPTCVLPKKTFLSMEATENAG
jgi:PII-like signaling protein